MSNQGFVKASNLDASEISSSFQLWNNLYDDGSVAEDIQLFQPKQELFWNSTPDLIVDNKFVFVSADSVYQDGDHVQVDGSWSTSQLVVGNTYVVANVGQDELGRWQFGFQGVTLSNISIVRFTRQITQTELLNLVEPNNTNQEYQPEVYGSVSNVRASLDNLSEELGRLANDLEEKLFPTQSVNLNARLFVEGVVIVQDPAAYNTDVERLTDAVGPGIFVSDPNSPQTNISTLRKDSRTDNPWTEGEGVLQTIAESANMNELLVNYSQLQVDGLNMTQLPTRQCMDVGEQMAALIDRSGKLWTLGANTDGSLGRSSTKRLDVVLTGLNPEPVWRQVSVGANHVLALTASGDVWAWGRNNRGQLGIGNQIPQSLPVQVLGLTGVTFISAGANSSACLIGDQLRVWGDNTHGQLALGNTNMQLTPQTVAGNYRTIQIADHTLVINTAGINSSGQLLASGRNDMGQLGLGNTTNRTTFSQVGTDITWSQVAVGSTHSLAIQSSGSMWAWGSNNRGQLGLSGTTNRLVPTATGTTQTWNHISAGTEYSLVINSNYALYGAGLNTSGQLGNNTTSNRNVWTQLGLAAQSDGLGRKTWAHAFASGLFSMGVNYKGELLTWGITTPFNAATAPQTQPVYLATTQITLSQDVDNSATMSVTDASQVIADSLVKNSLVPMGTRVQSVNLTLNQIILTIPVTLKATTQLTLVYDRWDSDQAVIFDRKSPMIVNGQTYYMLLRD